MKRNFFLAAVGFLLISTAAFSATSSPIELKKPTFAPVAWHATMSNGGFTLENQTNKIQYVQVTIQTGQLTVLTQFGHDLGKCRKDLDAQLGPVSVVCELGPNEKLNGDLDLSKGAEATGIYQVEMDQ